MDAIAVNGVEKRFQERDREFLALKGVSLHVKKGEVFGLLGPNGAGKTTLLSIIIKLVVPEAGRVEILGKDITKDPSILEKINFVSGDTKFHWVLETEDILRFYGLAYKLPGKEREKRIQNLISFFGLEEVRNKRFSHLSTGQRMRLIFAKAMLNHPEVLLLDEPTLGLDPSIAIRVREEIKRVNKKFGTTILLTSHYMHEVEQLADRVAFINEGEIIDSGKVGEVKLRQFRSYEVMVRVDKVKNPGFLRKQGFQITGTYVKKKLKSNEDLRNVLSLLNKKGYEVLEVETLKPTLEDYFVKIMKRGMAAKGNRQKPSSSGGSK